MQDEQQITQRERQDDKEKAKLKPIQRLRSPEALIFLLGVFCLVLVGPLRDALASVPLLLFLATLALFLVPGALLARLLLGRRLFPGASLAPLAFVLSTGIFGLPGILALTLRSSFDAYLWICGAILAGFLILAAARAIRRRSYAENETVPEAGFPNVLWIPFGGLAGVLAYTSLGKVQLPGDDSWLYLAYIRDFLAKNTLALYSPVSDEEVSGFTRQALNAWLPEQALLSQVSGIDPVELTQKFLAPALVVMTLLAFYALARILFRNETAALLASCLAALLFLVDLGFSPLASVMAPSIDLVGRVTEDKFVAWFVFLPVALGLAVWYLRDRRARYLLFFAFVYWSTAIVHPLGLAFIGVCVAGFGVVHLATNPRDKGSWAAFGGLLAVMLGILLPPVAYLLVTGSSTLSQVGAIDTGVAASMVDAWVNRYHLLLVLGDGSYVMHPSLLLSPAMLATYLVGVPFLVWRLKRSLAAQLLLGVLLSFPVLIYVPPIATFIAKFIGPWDIHRLSWPMLLAAPLTLGWVTWEVLSFLGSRLAGSGYRTVSWIASVLPVLFVVALAAAATPLVVAGVRSADDSGKIPQESGSCTDPTFRWMQDVITSTSSILAPDSESSCVPAYSASAKVMSSRYSAGSTWEKLLKTSVVTPVMLELIQQYEVEYVLLPVNSPLNAELKHVPGFSMVDNPGDRYRVYRVDPKKIEVNPTTVANEYLEAEKPNAAVPYRYLEAGNRDAAVALYKKAVLQGSDEDQWFLAHIGLGQLYAKEGRFSEAAQNYEEALALDPDNPVLYPPLAKAYESAGDQHAAREALEKGVSLFPRNVGLRAELGQLLQSTDQKAAVREYQAIVEMYPKVPDYRVQLGTALNLARNPQEADEEFGRAISLDPRSAELRSKIGFANQQTGRLQEAAKHYEAATELAPDSQFYAYELGFAYSLLSIRNGRDEELFTRAEEELKRVMELEPSPSSQARGKDMRPNAQLALGDLYKAWGRPEEAAAAYEEALKLDPSLEEAKKKLEEIRHK